ncbi:MAG: ABC transporter permease [Peptococcaceae bacterium]|nr:MAG: ABC transporter permease [Peptococcaceae bacterium]
MQRLLEIYQYREMLINLVAKELRARYKGSFFGFMWTFFNPLFMLIIYTVVFSYFMRIQVENYSMFLFVALLPWNFFQTSLTMGVSSIVSNSSLVKKIYFPREILPLSVTLSNLVNYALSLVILLPALLFFKIELSFNILWFPVVLLFQFLFVYGMALIVSALNVYFRDLEHITGIVMMAWFFLTPVLYPLKMVPEKVLGLIYLNPMAPFVESYRNIFFYGRPPALTDVGIMLPVGLLFFLLGGLVFARLQREFAEEV